MQSSLRQPDIVDELIIQECEKGFLLGPYQPDTVPFKVYRVSPLGLVTGKYSGKHRLIVDLSSPHNDPDCPSINDLIDKDQCSLSYVKIDDAVKIIQRKGRGALLCKFDIQDAFKLCPIRKEQWHLFGIKWKQQIYFYHRFVFGSRSSPVLFDKLSQAICWIAAHNYEISDILHLLDDFLTVDGPNDCGERTFALVSCLFYRLNIPLNQKKTIGPTTVVEYLGIILDTLLMEARLPLNKLQRILDFLDTMLDRRTCTKLQLLQLLGHLNFASRIILAGRSFVSYLITLSTTVTELHHHVTLTSDCRKDIVMWKQFLQGWNGKSFFYDCNYTLAADMHLFTDASSTVGFGIYYNTYWLAERWSPDILAELKRKYTVSMAFMELYPIVVAAVIFGHSWTSKKILFHCDNLGTVQIIRKGRSRSPLIMKLMRRLTWCAAKFNFIVLAEHVSGKDNVIADYLSRFQIDDFLRACPDAQPTPVPCPPDSEIMWD